MMTGIERLKRFAKSPHHAWLALLTLGVGAATLSSLGILVGATAYAMGWIFLPDSKFFKMWLGKGRKSEDDAKLRDFLFKRRQLYDALRDASRTRYDALAGQIQSLQKEFSRDHRLNPDIVRQRSERLSNLAWTYLRLLHTGEMLERFVESENPMELRDQIGEVEKQIAQTGQGTASALSESLQSRLGPLKTRLEKRESAEADLMFTRSEQERIVELVKLIRADHFASRDAGFLSDEIDGAASQLDRTRDWLRDMEFDTSPADVPESLTASAPLEMNA